MAPTRKSVRRMRSNAAISAATERDTTKAPYASPLEPRIGTTRQMRRALSTTELERPVRLAAAQHGLRGAGERRERRDHRLAAEAGGRRRERRLRRLAALGGVDQERHLAAGQALERLGVRLGERERGGQDAVEAGHVAAARDHRRGRDHREVLALADHGRCLAPRLERLGDPAGAAEVLADAFALRAVAAREHRASPSNRKTVRVPASTPAVSSANSWRVDTETPGSKTALVPGSPATERTWLPVRACRSAW